MSFSWFVSVDDHLIEPERLWQERLPQKWRDTGPSLGLISECSKSSRAVRS